MFSGASDFFTDCFVTDFEDFYNCAGGEMLVEVMAGDGLVDGYGDAGDGGGN